MTGLGTGTRRSIPDMSWYTVQPGNCSVVRFHEVFTFSIHVTRQPVATLTTCGWALKRTTSPTLSYEIESPPVEGLTVAGRIRAHMATSSAKKTRITETGVDTVESVEDNASEIVEPKASAISTGGGRPLVYRLKDGTRVPGATTVLGKFKDPGGLIHWAWELGRDGVDYRDARDKAGDAGSIAHQWIDDDVHRRQLTDFKESAERDKAYTGYLAFQKWRKGVNLEIIDTERPLVSELHRFGGTYDALCMVDGLVTLLDWKTSNRVYTEHVAQLAAYRQLIRENTKKEVNGARLLRVGKELGDFHDHSFPPAALDLGWERFQASLWLFNADAKLKKAVGV